MFHLGQEVDEMFCASVVYPADIEGFDFDYFATQHAPMFAGLLGDACVKFEVHRPVVAPGAPAPPFAGAAYFWVSSGDALGAVLAEHGEAVYADIARFSPVQPVRGWSEVV